MSRRDRAGLPDLLRRLGGAPTAATAGPAIAPSETPTAPEVRRWLIDKLSELATFPASEIDPGEPFSSYGLGSREGLALCGGLEEWLALKLPPSLVWEHPTIDEVTAYVTGELQRRDAACDG